MTAMRFYSNENFPLQGVNALRTLGHDVVTIQERGYGGRGISDADVLQYATQDQRVVLTLNRRDFIELHRLTDGNHAGIIVCTVDPDFAGQAGRIDSQVKSVQNMAGQLLRVNRG